MKILLPVATSLILLTSPAQAQKSASSNPIFIASSKLQSCVSKLPTEYKEQVRLAFEKANPGKKLPRFLRIKNKKKPKAKSSKRDNSMKKKSRNKQRSKKRKSSPERLIKRMNMLAAACNSKTLHTLDFTRKHKK